MPSITPMMSAILRLEAVIASIVPITCPTTAPPCEAAALAAPASCVAVSAVAALLLTVDVSSSIDAAVCCRLAACSSVRWLRSALPCAISWLPVATDSADCRTWRSTPSRRTRMSSSARTRRPISSSTSLRQACVRSPDAMWATASPSWRSGRETQRRIIHCNPRPRATAVATIRARILASMAQCSCMASRSDTSATTHQPVALLLRNTANESLAPVRRMGIAASNAPSPFLSSASRKGCACGKASSTFLPLAAGCSTNSASAGAFFGSMM